MSEYNRGGTPRPTRVLALQVDKWGPHLGSHFVKSKARLHCCNSSRREPWLGRVALASRMGKTSPSAGRKTTVMQNKCLWTVARKLRATPVKAFEAKTFVAPLPLPLNRLQAKAQSCMLATGQSRVIAEQCKKLERNSKSRVGCGAFPLSPQEPRKWHGGSHWVLSLRRHLCGYEESEYHVLHRTEALQKARKQETLIRHKQVRRSLKNPLK